MSPYLLLLAYKLRSSQGLDYHSIFHHRNKYIAYLSRPKNSMLTEILVFALACFYVKPF
jgi:hypothetical protein